MGKRFFCLLAAAVLFLSACGAAPESGAASAEETAETVLRSVYGCDTGDSARLEAAMQEGDDSLKEYARTKVGDCITEEGVDGILTNRLLSRSVSEWPETEVQIQSVELTPAYTATETECIFQYQVEAAPAGEAAQVFTGEVGLSLAGEEWKVNSMS